MSSLGGNWMPPATNRVKWMNISTNYNDYIYRVTLDIELSALQIIDRQYFTFDVRPCLLLKPFIHSKNKVEKLLKQSQVFYAVLAI